MKLTKEYLETLIEKTEYQRYGDRMTLCFITVKGGFVVIGKASCVDAANFNEAIGKQIAYDNAFEKLWELEGYHVKRIVAE